MFDGNSVILITDFEGKIYIYFIQFFKNIYTWNFLVIAQEKKVAQWEYDLKVVSAGYYNKFV